jgi:hypothetical protein
MLCIARRTFKDIKMRVKRARDTARQQNPPEDSIDELANALLDDSMQRGITMSTPSAASPSEVPGSASSKATPETLNKPLPALPVEDRVLPRLDKPLPPISTYHYIPRTTEKDAKSNAENLRKKRNISSPVLQSLHTHRSETPVTTAPNKSGYIDSPRDNPYSASEDAADLSGKLLGLMRIKTAKSPQSPSLPPQTGGHVRKNSRFQRGKEVFVRATQAITDRLGNGGEKKIDKSMIQKIDPPSSSPDELADLHYRLDTDNESRRRVAEGANLGKPKVKNLIGNGDVKRKPLRVYDDMKPLQSHPSSHNDPFTDEKKAPANVSLPDFTDFDFNIEFNERPDRPSTRASAHEPLLQSMQVDVDDLEPPQQKFRHSHHFSEQLSGLAQNPPNMFFSSSPAAESTPRYRLEREFDAKGKKRLSTVLASSPSQLDLSPPGSEVVVPAMPERSVSRSTISLKRKKATTDLRGSASPFAKKAKKQENQETPFELEPDTIAVASPIPLGQKDPNKRLSRSKIPASKEKGLKIFEVGKGKSTAPRRAESSAKTKPRFMGKRSSIPVPVKQAVGDERRVSTPVEARPMAYDEMSIDELA